MLSCSSGVLCCRCMQLRRSSCSSCAAEQPYSQLSWKRFSRKKTSRKKFPSSPEREGGPLTAPSLADSGKCLACGIRTGAWVSSSPEEGPMVWV